MKRAIAVVIMSILMIGIFVGCTGSKEDFTCDFCRKEVNSVPHMVTYKDKEMKVCDDCYKGFQKLDVIK